MSRTDMTPAVLVVDDGELEAVRELLGALGVPFERVAGAKARPPLREPDQLLVTTSRLAMSLGLHRGPASPTTPRAVWVAFVVGASKTESTPLKRAGFDFLVREPVHPAALRLLLLRGLYSGEDKRRVPRVAFGYEVSFRAGLFPRKAVLTDLSPRGCRLLTSRPPKRGEKLRVRIPREVADGRALDLTGSALRVSPAEDEGGSPGETAVGVCFARLRPSTQRRLRTVLIERTAGPAQLPRPLESEPGADQRAHARRAFAERIVALAGGDSTVVIGVDLSEGGMRIEPHADVAIGDSLRLAIQPSDREEPFLVEGEVIRDDGEAGLALRFDWLEDGARERLSAFASRLPAIEVEPGRGAVLARVLGGLGQLTQRR